MTISALIRLFERGETKGMKKGLENILSLSQAFGSPERTFQSIHVTGTNGKGSVSTKIARCLQIPSRKVGLYTSPHIHSFQERIQVDGIPISLDDSERLLGDIFRLSEEIECIPTFFEILTMLAFLYFAEKKVDVAVFEVGMGGRWDATNIIHPLLSIITSIDRDHTRYLGSTLDEIAFEKSGIIKSGVPVLVGQRATHFPIFQQIAKQKGCPFYPVVGDFAHYEEENRLIAKQALALLPFTELLPQGLEVTPPCRFQQIEREIPIVLDVGHNPGALQALFDRLKKSYPGKKITTLFALSEDKEIDECLARIVLESNYLFVTEASSRRALSTKEIAFRLRQKSFTKFQEISAIIQAFTAARAFACKENHLLVVTGTFYIMDSILLELNEI